MLLHIKELLGEFEELTQTFSSRSPLIGDIVPAFEYLGQRLEKFRDDMSLPKIIRFAAHQGRIVVERYYAKSDTFTAYRLALCMSLGQSGVHC